MVDVEKFNPYVKRSNFCGSTAGTVGSKVKRAPWLNVTPPTIESLQHSETSFAHN